MGAGPTQFNVFGRAWMQLNGPTEGRIHHPSE
jgi:hypothetical protein